MQNDNREFFTSLKELVDHLYSGGKVGFECFGGGYNYLALSEDDFISRDCKAHQNTVRSILSTKTPERYWKYKEEPKYITWAEVPEYLDKGHKLRPEGMHESWYVAQSNMGYWGEYGISTQHHHPMRVTQHYAKCKWEVVE